MSTYDPCTCYIAFVTQVRYAGYTLMGVLCTHEMGMEALLTECHAVIPAGLWSLCTQTLLNNQECDVVRGKVCIIYPYLFSTLNSL